MANANRITLTLSDETYRRAQRLAQITQRPVAEVLADTIAVSLPQLPSADEGLRPVESLSDAEVLACADMQLSSAVDRRLSALLERQQEGALAEGEAAELASLMQIFYQRQLRKAQGLAEAVRRGLRQPPAP